MCCTVVISTGLLAPTTAAPLLLPLSRGVQRDRALPPAREGEGASSKPSKGGSEEEEEEGGRGEEKQRLSQLRTIDFSFLKCFLLYVFSGYEYP